MMIDDELRAEIERIVRAEYARIMPALEARIDALERRMFDLERDDEWREFVNDFPQVRH